MERTATRRRGEELMHVVTTPSFLGALPPDPRLAAPVGEIKRFDSHILETYYAAADWPEALPNTRGE